MNAQPGNRMTARPVPCMRPARSPLPACLLAVSLALATAGTAPAAAPGPVPRPDHVVILILENHGDQSVLGSASAPYINKLAADSEAAAFTQSYALTHPSQPNYLMLYSGSKQGITDDNVPANLPFTASNLGAALLAKSLGFAGYSEDLPATGFTGASNKAYARKHAPWVNWQGTGVNGVPPSVNLPFSAFPTTDYAKLPTLAYVVPNLQDDMHDGTVAQGDAWIKANLDGYAQWAKTHNSLFILTFDEDENAGGPNLIPTIFLGPMVKKGSYAERITHYEVLRTLEDMYGLAHSGAAATALPITDIWKVAAAARDAVSPMLPEGFFVSIGKGTHAATFTFPPMPGRGADLEIFTAAGASLARSRLKAGQSSYTWAYGNSGDNGGPGHMSAGGFRAVLRQGRSQASLGFFLQN